ncbi:MAG: acyltransferase [Lachnospiraceae bacterium]|nr:acyltransferase [Lachnospiraceae bacterium]
MSGKQREKWIDLVKCIAIAIVMINHSQLDVPEVKFWGGMFFVPVFFVVSGFTYRSREESFLSFLGRKAKRLLLPYITANGILFAFFFFKNVFLADGNPSDMLVELVGIFYARNQLFSWATPTLFFPDSGANIYLLTLLNSPTWFLPALFLTMVLFEVLFRLSKRDGRKMLIGAVVLLCLSNLYHYLFPLLLPWSVDAVSYFLIMFLWGYFAGRKGYLQYFDRHKWVLLLLGGVFLFSAMINGSTNYSIADYGRSAMLALYNALVSSTILMYLCYKAEKYIPRILTVVGQQTLFLLCYHLFAFSVFETIWTGIHPAVTIVVTLVLLTMAAWGKEKLLYAKKQRH